MMYMSWLVINTQYEELKHTTGAHHDRNIQYAVFYSWQLDLSFTFLPDGIFHWLADEHCHSS